MTESQILAAIRKHLGRKPDLVLWRLSTAGAIARNVRGPSVQMYRAGLSVNGGSDLIGILHRESYGQFFALEVKTPEHLRAIVRACKQGEENHLSDSDRAQLMFMDVVHAHGGFGAFVASVNAAEAAYERAHSGALE